MVLEHMEGLTKLCHPIHLSHSVLTLHYGFDFDHYWSWLPSFLPTLDHREGEGGKGEKKMDPYQSYDIKLNDGLTCYKTAKVWKA